MTGIGGSQSRLVSPDRNSASQPRAGEGVGHGADKDEG